MDKFEYVYTRNVRAAKWTGNNLDEMKELLKDVVDSNEFDGPEVYSDYVEAMFIRSLGENIGGYNMLIFYAWGRDNEVDPDPWVVVYDNGEDGQIMNDTIFNNTFKKKSDPGSWG